MAVAGGAELPAQHPTVYLPAMSLPTCPSHPEPYRPSCRGSKAPGRHQRRQQAPGARAWAQHRCRWRWTGTHLGGSRPRAATEQLLGNCWAATQQPAGLAWGIVIGWLFGRQPSARLSSAQGHYGTALSSGLCRAYRLMQQVSQCRLAAQGVGLPLNSVVCQWRGRSRRPSGWISRRAETAGLGGRRWTSVEVAAHQLASCAQRLAVPLLMKASYKAAAGLLGV